MSQNKKHKDLKSLEKEWYAILKATGFNDIEETKGNDRLLKKYSKRLYRKDTYAMRASNLAYYEQISSAASEYKFKNEIEKFILTQTGEGVRIKQIVEALLVRGHKINRKTVMFIIRRHETLWGIRVWSLKQMNLKTPIK